MKKMFLIIIAAIFVNLTLFAGDNSFFKGGDIDVPFFKSLFMDDEEYVKQELLKCKDVESVEFEIAYKDHDDLFYEIHVYLTNHRFLSFYWVRLSFYKSSQTNLGDSIELKQINDFAFREQAFKARYLRKDGITYNLHENFGEIRFFKQLLPDIKASNMLEIIENIDAVYNFVKSLPESSSNEIIEFEGFYEKTFEIPKEFDNGIPVSIIERKTDAASEKWYEEGYKFYKYSIKNTNNNGYYKTDY